MRHARTKLTFVLLFSLAVNGAAAQDLLFNDGFELCMTPDVIEWDGGGDGITWSDPANWVGDAVPGNGARVSIDLDLATTVDYGPGLNTTLACLRVTSNLRITNAVLVLDGSATVQGDLEFVSGTLTVNGWTSVHGAFSQDPVTTLDGTGTLRVDGLYTWLGGSQRGEGRIVANGGMAIAGANTKIMGRDLVLNGASSFAGTADVRTYDGRILTVNAGFDIATDADIDAYFGAPPSLHLNGTLTKSAGTGRTIVEMRLDNDGAIAVNAGQLQIGNVLTSGASSGSFTVAPGAGLTVLGAHAFGASSSLNGAGDFTYAGGLGVFEGSWALTGLFTLGFASNSAELDFPAGANLAGDVDLKLGRLLVGGPVNIAGTLLLQPPSTVDGPGTLTIGGLFTWVGGSQLGEGETVANGGAEFSSGNDKGLRQRVLSLNGPTTWLAGNIDARNAATINVNAPFDIATDADILHLQFAEPVLNINESLFKSAATGLTQLAMIATNAGTVSVQAGQLQFAKSYTQTGDGSLTIGIAGPADFDTLAVTGAATLGGTLEIVLEGGYEPPLGESFVVLTAASVTGTFDTVTGTAIVPGRRFDLVYGASGVTLTVIAE